MTFAIVLIECVRGLSSSAHNAIVKVHGVLESHEIHGSSAYDLVVKVNTDNEAKFKSTIIALKSIAGIAAITVSIAYGYTQ